ncbi:MAG: NUDIX hydrolase [Chitinophagaceae bacterium]|nr:NUDIX hydrolase [Chitinophagaceae bacterium]
MKDPLAWQTLSSEYIFKDRWFTVRKDICLTPGGVTVNPYYVYEFPVWVGGVAMTADGKFIMVRQYRHALGETGIEIPGGCVDEGDADYQSAIARELLEETGYTFSKYEYLGRISPNPSTNTNLLHMFLATGGVKTNEQSLDANEEIDVVLLSADDVKTLLKENRIVQAMHVTALFYALQKLGMITW